MRGLAADLRHAIRLYARTPWSSALAVVVVAAAIALVTAFLSLWADLALKGRPGFDNASGLATVVQTDGRTRAQLSMALLDRIGEEVSSIESIAGTALPVQYLERAGAEPEPFPTELVTAQYFPSLEPRLAIGRAFTAADHTRDAEPVAILSYTVWQREFGGRENVLGETLRVSGPNMIIRTQDGEARGRDVVQNYRIVGVMAEGNLGTLYDGVGAWMPFEQVGEVLFGAAGDYRRFNQLFGLARPADGASLEAIANELEGRYGPTGQDLAGLPGFRFDVGPGLAPDVAQHRDTLKQLRVFLAGSVLIALVAASNVSLFLLSRAPGRRRELAIRMAVGAPLRRLGRQLATESSLLVLVATLLGVLASLWLTAYVGGLAFLQQARFRDASPLDWRVLGTVATFALVLAVLVSLAPVAGLKKIGIAAGSRSITARAGWGQRLAGTAQLIVAAVIGAAAIAFVWYLAVIVDIDRGFSATRTYVAQVGPPEGVNFFGVGVEALRAERESRRETLLALPGVEAVGFTVSVPGQERTLMRRNLRLPDAEDTVTTAIHTADPTALDLLGVRLLDGRLLVDDDGDNVVVNETLARRLWQRTDVAGETLPLAVPPGAEAPRWEVVGVISDIAYGHPTVEAEPIAYQVINQGAALEFIVIRSGMPPADLNREIQRLVDAGDLQLRIFSVQRIEDLWGRQIAPDRARTMLTAGSALVVLALAAFGFYGTQRFVVTAGRREYAILAALGAGPRALGRLVLRRGLWQGLPGLVAGGLLAFIVVAWMRDDFVSPDVSPGMVTLMVVAALGALLLGASVGPARQVRNTAPAPLLREE